MKSDTISRFTLYIFCFNIITAMFASIVPSFEFGNGGIRIAEIAIICLLVWIFLIERKLYLTKNIIGKVMSAIIFSLGVYLLIAGLIGQLVFQLSASEFIKTIAPAVRVLIYSLFYFIGIHIFKCNVNNIHITIRLIILLITVHGIYGFIQFFSLNFGYPHRSLLPYLPIEYAPTGFTEAVFSLASYGLFLVSIKIGCLFNKYNKNQLYELVYFIFGHLIIISTFRRSQLIAAIFVSLFVAVMGKVKLIKKIALVLIFLFISSAPFIFVDSINQALPALGVRLESIMALFQGNTAHPGLGNWHGRVSGTWADYLLLIKQYPLGTGLYPQHLLGVGSDSAYLTHVVWGSVFAGILYTLVLIIPFLYSLHLIIFKDLEDKPLPLQLSYTTLAMSCSMIITGIAGGGTLSLPERVPFWVILAAFVVALERTER